MAVSDRLTPKSRRPIVELLPCLDSLWLQNIGAIPTAWNSRTAIALDLKVPGLRGAICTATQIEVENSAGDVQAIRLRWYHPISGAKPMLVCPSCQRAQKVLYCHRYHLACRLCHRAVYTSQCKDSRSRPQWQQAKAKARCGIVPVGTKPAVYGALAYYDRRYGL